jgi:hypothetical protein
MPHLEFVVLGPPVSHQTSDRANLKAWQATIKLEASKGWTSAPLKGKLKFLLINFHEGDKPPLDDDNMVKPIRETTGRFATRRRSRFASTTPSGSAGLPR